MPWGPVTIRRARKPPPPRDRRGYLLTYTARDVAAALAVKERTVWDWCKAGRLVGVKVGRVWRVERAALKAFLRQRRP